MIFSDTRNEKRRVAADAIVRVPPLGAIGGRISVMVVERLIAVEEGLDCSLALHAGSNTLRSEEADGSEDGKAEHRGHEEAS